MDALFGVVNIPNVVWIDEQGMIVRPAEPGWPDARTRAAGRLRWRSLPKVSRAQDAPRRRTPTPIDLQAMLAVRPGPDSVRRRHPRLGRARGRPVVTP